MKIFYGVSTASPIVLQALDSGHAHLQRTAGSILLSDSRFCSSFLLWCLYTHTASHCPGFLNRRKEFRVSRHLAEL